MPTTQKLQVVIDVELTYDEQARSSYPLGSSPPDPEAETDMAHARALLAALRADPAKYAEFVETVVVWWLEVAEENRQLIGLAGIGCPYSASLNVLRKVMPTLPPESQEHFQRADNEAWLSESVDLIFNAVKATPIKMSLEYPAALS